MFGVTYSDYHCTKQDEREIVGNANGQMCRNRTPVKRHPSITDY